MRRGQAFIAWTLAGNGPTAIPPLGLVPLML